MNSFSKLFTCLKIIFLLIDIDNPKSFSHGFFNFILKVNFSFVTHVTKSECIFFCQKFVYLFLLIQKLKNKRKIYILAYFFILSKVKICLKCDKKICTILNVLWMNKHFILEILLEWCSVDYNQEDQFRLIALYLEYPNHALKIIYLSCIPSTLNKLDHISGYNFLLKCNENMVFFK